MNSEPTNPTSPRDWSKPVLSPDQMATVREAQLQVGYPYLYLIIVTLLAALIAGYFVHFEQSEVRLGNSIKRSMVSTAAIATVDTRTGFRRSISYELSYYFTVPGAGKRFHNTYFSTNAGESLNNTDFNRLTAKRSLGLNIDTQHVKITGSIPVVYNRNDPSENLTQYDMQTLPNPNKIVKSIAFVAALIWLVVLVPLGFLIRMIIRRNIYFRKEREVLLAQRKAKSQQSEQTP